MGEEAVVQFDMPVEGEGGLLLIPAAFKHLQRVALMFSASGIVPKVFQGERGVSNCVIALEMAHRLKCSALMLMQNMVIVHEKPGFEAKFIIAIINSSEFFAGRMSFSYFDDGDEHGCRASAIDKETGEEIEGPAVTVGMAKANGWWSKSGSLWPKLTDLMLSYRAATFFARLYCPDLLMGMHTVDELREIGPGGREIKDLTPGSKPAPETGAEGPAVEDPSLSSPPESDFTPPAPEPVKPKAKAKGKPAPPPEGQANPDPPPANTPAKPPHESTDPSEAPPPKEGAPAYASGALSIAKAFRGEKTAKHPGGVTLAELEAKVKAPIADWIVPNVNYLEKIIGDIRAGLTDADTEFRPPPPAEPSAPENPEAPAQDNPSQENVW